MIQHPPHLKVSPPQAGAGEPSEQVTVQPGPPPQLTVHGPSHSTEHELYCEQLTLLSAPTRAAHVVELSHFQLQ